MSVQRKRRRDFLRGMKDSLTVGLGIVPLGLAFGLLVTQTGFAWWWAPVFSTMIYAGSVEFLAIGLVTGSASLFAAAVTAFMVNFRHIFYGLSYPKHSPKRLMAKIYTTYTITDETYAIVATKKPDVMTGPRIIGVHLFCQACWVLSGIAGALGGTALPENIHGMEFALTALFIVLGYEAFQNNKDISLPITAVVVGVMAAVVAPKALLVVALLTYFVILFIRFSSPKFDELLVTRVGKDPVSRITTFPPKAK